MTTIHWYDHGSANHKKIAITFDDGPNPHCAEAIMKILAARDVRATFFAVGKWAEQWPDVLKGLAERHLIGNHSYLHEKPARDFERGEETLVNILGRPSTYVRAPYFIYSAELLRWVGNRILVDGDLITEDWSLTDPDKIYDAACGSGRAKPGSIIVLHDGSELEHELATRPRPMIAALPRILDHLQEQGFSLVGVDQLDFEDEKG